jgi:hypothetical protein
MSYKLGGTKSIDARSYIGRINLTYRRMEWTKGQNYKDNYDVDNGLGHVTCRYWSEQSLKGEQ